MLGIQYSQEKLSVFSRKSPFNNNPRALQQYCRALPRKKRRIFQELMTTYVLKKDRIFPSQRTLARSCGVTREWVNKFLAELVSLGLLIISRNWMDVNEYTFAPCFYSYEYRLYLSGVFHCFYGHFFADRSLPRVKRKAGIYVSEPEFTYIYNINSLKQEDYSRKNSSFVFFVVKKDTEVAKSGRLEGIKCGARGYVCSSCKKRAVFEEPWALEQRVVRKKIEEFLNEESPLRAGNLSVGRLMP